MRYSIVSLVLLSFLLLTCTKEKNVIKSNKVEVCDFGELNKNPLLSREEFEMARVGGSGPKPKDSDRDGIPDTQDNCPKIKNANQLDSDKDGIGDVCDPYPYGNEPAVTSVILLDFDGYSLNSPLWNGGVPYQCLPSGLYPEQIQLILANVQSDFVKYNILVTTDENVYLNSNRLKRMRVVVTTSSEIYPNVAGVAYVGSMFWGDDTPAFVFSNLLYYNEGRVRLATSHEAGHTVGLYHQSQYDANCNLMYTYKPCDYTTNTGPIMGSIGVTCQPMWWIGPTPNGCTFIQDDNGILTTNLGIK